MSYENKEKKNDEASNSLSMSSLSSHQRAGQKRTCLDENDKPKLPTSIQIHAKKPIHPHRRHLSYSSLYNLSAYQEEQSHSSGEIFVENTDQNSQDSDFMQDDGSDSNSVKESDESEESSIEEEEDEQQGEMRAKDHNFADVVFFKGAAGKDPYDKSESLESY